MVRIPINEELYRNDCRLGFEAVDLSCLGIKTCGSNTERYSFWILTNVEYNSRELDKNHQVLVA